MEFKFPVMDAYDQGHLNPVYHTHSSPSSSSNAYFAGQPIRGFSNGNFGEGYLRPEIVRGRLELTEEIRRQLEKEKIRAEIIAEENERRRILREEVLNEMMIERQMAMRSAGGFPSPFMPSHDRLFEPIVLHRQPIGFEERIAASLEVNYDSRHQIVPVQGSSMIKVTPTPLPDASGKEVFVLGNPNDVSLSGAKRKSTPSVAGTSSEPRAVDSKKKVTEEWSCAICQVSATSERGLKDHIRGKKHQKKEKALLAQKTGANVGLGVPPKKPTVTPIKPASTTTQPSSRDKKKSKTIKKSVDPTGETSTTSNASDPNVTENKKDKFKCWCEICGIGVHSEKVMNNHKKGKKHKLHQKGKLEAEKPKTETKNVTEEKTDTETKKAVIVETVKSDDFVNQDVTGEEIVWLRKMKTVKNDTEDVTDVEDASDLVQ